MMPQKGHNLPLEGGGMDEEEWGGEWQIGIESNGLKLANDGAEEHMQCDESPRRQWTASKIKTRRELAVRGEQQEGERMEVDEAKAQKKRGVVDERVDDESRMPEQKRARAGWQGGQTAGHDDEQEEETASETKERQDAVERGVDREVEEAEQREAAGRMGAMERMQVAANHGEAAWGAVGESAREPHAGSVWMQAATNIHEHTQDIQNETDRREGWGALGTKKMGERGASENRRRGEPGMMCEGESDGWEKRQRSGGRERGQDEQAVERRRVRQQVELKKDGKELGVTTLRLLNQSQEKGG